MATIAEMVLYGTASAMPGAGIPGRIYYTSDTEQISATTGRVGTM